MRITTIRAMGFFFLSAIAIQTVNAQKPIALHPDNPHYFLYKGKPTVLVSSAEHYGAVLNTAFDYRTYFAILKQHGFNQTRMFSGFYREGKPYNQQTEKPFEWEHMQNTLAPRPGKFITPWVEVQPSTNEKNAVYNLNQWNPEYFKRLKDYLTEAAKHDVIVEVVLFTAIYTKTYWSTSPLNPKNNNGATGTEVSYIEFHSPEHKLLRSRQLAMVEKIVKEVNEFDNIYFEICNEPYWLKGIPEEEPTIKEQLFLPEFEEWQRDVAATITKTESTLPKKHLIAQNIANNYKKVDELNPSVSIVNFHYSFPPRAVTENYSLSKPISFDETGDGCNAPDRRIEAWAFMLAGGAVYSNLDWSFSNDDVTGLGRNPSGKRESGQEVRSQLNVLLKTLNSFDFVKSSPVTSKIKLKDGVLAYGIGVTAKDYLIYCVKQHVVPFEKLEVELPPGQYKVKIIDPIDGKEISSQSITQQADGIVVPLPEFADDILVRIMK
ncbi:hypothetical protein WBG78_07695 [Chryseolinea sp. T2]|uniref:hypothetical protein n=1 Tax=Chryseolinea sp. T2 TaxID=3129255 RepID=UPI0030780390